MHWVIRLNKEMMLGRKTYRNCIVRGNRQPDGLNVKCEHRVVRRVCLEWDEGVIHGLRLSLRMFCNYVFDAMMLHVFQQHLRAQVVDNKIIFRIKGMCCIVLCTVNKMTCHPGRYGVNYCIGKIQKYDKSKNLHFENLCHFQLH